MPVSSEALDDLSGARASVDEIAHEDEQHFLDRAVRQLVVDFLEQLLQQIEAPVHVAHGISAPPPRAGGAAMPLRSEVEHSAPLSPSAGPSGKNLQAGQNNDENLKPLLNRKERQALSNWKRGISTSKALPSSSTIR
jgi:hypothetical protein